MKAIVNTQYGPPERLGVREIDPPWPGRGQVLLRVLACGANASDVEMVTGRPADARIYGLRRPRVRTPGSDVVGVVEALGPGVSGVEPGQTVFGDIFDTFGGFAEQVAAPAERLIALPEALDPVTAAALPQPGVIALQAMRRVQPGMRVLINGAGGGMGAFAIQLAKAQGAHVTAVDNAGKADLMVGLGADAVIDYRATDFTGTGERWDMILDLFGTHSMRDIARVLAAHGRYAWVGGTMRALGSLLTAGTIRSFGAHRFRLFAARPSTADLAEIAARVASGEITVPMDGTYALAETGAALARIAEGRALGRVVIRPS